jgi:hypothetical protein
MHTYPLRCGESNHSSWARIGVPFLLCDVCKLVGLTDAMHLHLDEQLREPRAELANRIKTRLRHSAVQRSLHTFPVPIFWIGIMLVCRARYATRVEVLLSPQSPVVRQRAYGTAGKLTFRYATRPCAKPRAAPRSSHFQRRGAKTTTTLDFDSLPQGAIVSDKLPLQDDVEPEYPPLLQQVRNNMLKFSHCVLVTRVGGFYEVLSYILTLRKKKLMHIVVL